MNIACKKLRGIRAFTLAEVMMAMVTTMVVLAGIITANIYGIRMRQLTESKLAASDEARRAVAMMGTEIRSAFMVKIGRGTIDSFSEVAPDSTQAGSAIQIYPGTNLSEYVRYFWDAADERLKRTTNGMLASFVVASAVSNEMVFRAEDFRGNVLSNNFNNRVISMALDFSGNKRGVNSYDYYQLRTKFTRRTVL